MGILIILVPLALLLSGCGVAAYFWAHRSRQFDDLDSPAFRVLFEDDDLERNRNNER